jgi:hypothetical protein
MRGRSIHPAIVLRQPLDYVNYLDGLLEDPAPAYFRANLARLREAKQRPDPAGVFKAVPALG